MKGFRITRVLPLMAAALVLTDCGCDFFGTTGALLISDQDEVQLGAEFNQQLRDSSAAEYPIFVPKTAEETAFQDYVLGLAKSIHAAVPTKEKPAYDFQFTIIDKDVENAFAVPGGFVYIYTGIIKKMNDESELAGVLGHEIAHVTRHHYRASMVKVSGWSLLAQALIGDDAGQITKLVAASFVQMASLSVSRGHEADADEYGTIYTGEVGRNPMGIAKFFGRMPKTGFGWLSSHPGADDRVDAVTDQVTKTTKLNSLALDSANTNFTAQFLAKTDVIRKRP